MLTTAIAYGPSVDDGVCREVLINPDAPSHVIEHAYQLVRPGYATRAPASPDFRYHDQHAAKNQATPPNVLAYVFTQLARAAPDKKLETRLALGANRTPASHVLAAFATDRDPEVRAEDVRNASTAADVVRVHAALHPRVCADWV